MDLGCLNSLYLKYFEYNNPTHPNKTHLALLSMRVDLLRFWIVLGGGTGNVSWVEGGKDSTKYQKTLKLMSHSKCIMS